MKNLSLLLTELEDVCQLIKRTPFYTHMLEVDWELDEYEEAMHRAMQFLELFFALRHIHELENKKKSTLGVLQQLGSSLEEYRSTLKRRIEVMEKDVS